MTIAFYNIATGIISGTLSVPLTDQAQIAGLLAQGTGIIDIPDGLNGSNAMVDIANDEVVQISPSPSIPSLATQLTAALIKNGTVAKADFHPVSIAETNTALAAASLGTIK